MNWVDILNQYSNDALTAIALAHRIAPFSGASGVGANGQKGGVGPGNRVAAITALKKTLGTANGVTYALKFMGLVEMAALRALMNLGGTALADTIFNQLKAQGAPMLPSRLGPQQEAAADYQDTPHFEDVIARATCFGLIFSRDSQRGYFWQLGLAPADTLFIPESVVQHLEHNPDFAQPSRLKANTPDVVLTSSSFQFQRDLSRYWRHARKQGELAFTAQGWIYKSNFKTFLTALNMPASAANDEPSNPQLWFMRRMLTALDEFEGLGGEPFVAVREESQLLKMPIVERIKKVFDTWRYSGAWNELGRLPLDKQGYDSKRDMGQEAAPEMAAARDVLLRMMARLVAGHADEWVSTNSLIGQMRRQHYEFLLPRSKRKNYSSYYTPYSSISANPYGIAFPAVRDEAMGWTLVEQGFIVEILTGPLYWMGLVELGYNTGEETGENTMPTSYRLTETGAWLLGIGEPPEFVESGGRLVVQPNFTILAMEPINDQVLIDLDHFADVQGGDLAIVYQLTRESLYRGQQQGWSANRVMAFLEQHQGAPVAGNVRRTLEEWQLQHQRITIHRNAIVVQFADEESQTQTGESIGEFEPRGLGNHFALVQKGDAPALIEALRTAGWMPLEPAADVTAMAGASPAAAASTATHELQAIRLEDPAADPGEKNDLAQRVGLTFTQLTPSIWVLGQLAQFAEVDAKGHWAITPASVRTSINAGESVEQILAVLSDLNVEAVPTAVERLVRKWGGFFGEASLKSVMLLELSSFEVLTNLTSDPEIGPWLSAIEGASKPLAIVDGAQAEAVREALAERGVVFVEAHL